MVNVNAVKFIFLEYGLAIISFVLNLSVIIIFKCYVVNKKYSIPNLKLYLQAIIDTILALGLFSSGTLLNTTRSEKETTFLESLYVFIYESSKFTSIYVLLLTALSTMFFDYHSKKYVSEKRFVSAFIGVLFISIIPEMINQCYLFAWKSPLVQSDYQLTSGIVISITFIIIYLLLFYTYDSIYKNRRVQNQENSPGVEDVFGDRRNQEHHRLVLILLCMTTVYALGFLPQFISVTLDYDGDSIANNGDKQKGKDTFEMMEIFKLMYFSRTFINPLLTLVLKSDFYLGSLSKKKIISGKKGKRKKPRSSRPESTMSDLIIETSMQKRLITFETAL